MRPQIAILRAVGATLVALAAAASTALARPKSCNDVYLDGMRNGYAPVEGNYVIEPSPGVVFTVYCRDFTTVPKEYLSLTNTGGGYNFSQMTAGEAWDGTDVRTSFTKLRIDPKTLLVDTGDFTYSESTGQITHYGVVYRQVAYGVAADCFGSYSSYGIANIDLTGTPFEVFSVFAAEGWNPRGLANDVGLPSNQLSTTVSGKVVNLRGGGYCGAVGPDGSQSMFNSWVYLPRTPKLALQLRYVGP